jgi:hypothetical protein
MRDFGNGTSMALSTSLVFLLYQKGRDSRIFQAQDRLGQSTAATALAA